MFWPPLVLTVGEVMVGLPRLLSRYSAVQNQNGEVSLVIMTLCCSKLKWRGVPHHDDSLLPWNATHVPKSPLLRFLRNWKSRYLLQWHINSFPPFVFHLEPKKVDLGENISSLPRNRNFPNLGLAGWFWLSSRTPNPKMITPLEILWSVDENRLFKRAKWSSHDWEKWFLPKAVFGQFYRLSVA